MSGLDLCRELVQRECPLPLVLLTGTRTESLAVEALFFLAVTSGAPWLLYPVSFITAGGVVTLFFAATLVIVAQAVHSRRRITDKWGLLFLMNVTLFWTIIELAGLLAYKLWIHQCPLQG